MESKDLQHIAKLLGVTLDVASVHMKEKPSESHEYDLLAVDNDALIPLADRISALIVSAYGPNSNDLDDKRAHTKQTLAMALCAVAGMALYQQFKGNGRALKTGLSVFLTGLIGYQPFISRKEMPKNEGNQGKQSSIH